MPKRPKKQTMQKRSDDTRPDPVRVRSIRVRPGRLACDILIEEARYRYTNSQLAAYATRHYPDLPHHACVNGKAPSFGAVMESTSVAHLLEHIAISEQVRATSYADEEFVGTTEWLDEDAGFARVEISFKDDLEAMRAFQMATRFLNTAVITCLA